MKIEDLFENWGISGLELNVGFLKMEWQPQPDEQQAAWELYVEIITRIATQPLPDDSGDEKTALDSVYKLFEITRNLLREKGLKAQTFSKIAIVILNQKVRPFTAEWHKKSMAGAFEDPVQCMQFRQELKAVQQVLVAYTKGLAEIAGVEDFQHIAIGPMGQL